MDDHITASHCLIESSCLQQICFEQLQALSCSWHSQQVLGAAAVGLPGCAMYCVACCQQALDNVSSQVSSDSCHAYAQRFALLLCC
jgi:hypothetical protein